MADWWMVWLLACGGRSGPLTQATGTCEDGQRCPGVTGMEATHYRQTVGNYWGQIPCKCCIKWVCFRDFAQSRREPGRLRWVRLCKSLVNREPSQSRWVRLVRLEYDPRRRISEPRKPL